MSTEVRKRWEQKNAEHLRAYQKKYYEDNKPQLIAQQREYVQRRRAEDPVAYRAPKTEYQRKHRRSRPEDWKRWNRDSRDRLKAEMFAAYGDHCYCCGEDRVSFLSLDHTNRDGAQHRRSLARGRRIASTRQVLLDLKKRGWPKEGFRVACMNCNWATRFGDTCPHEEMFAALASGSVCFAGDK